MKKLFLLLTIATWAFTSCSKGDNGDTMSNDLGGTEWEWEGNGLSATLYFLDDVRVKRTRVLYGYSYNGNFVYSFNGKTRTGTIYNYKDGESVSFSIENNRLTLELDKYYKQ